MSCTECKLHTQCKNVRQMGSGKKSARIMVVSESPYQTENLRNQHMSGKGGRLLRALLSDVEIDLDDVYFTTVVKCSTPEDRLPKPDEIDACKDYLLSEIDVIQPEIIVPTGNISMKVTMGLVGITKHRGKMIEKDGIKYFPIIHPNFVLKQPKWLEIFGKDIENLSIILNGRDMDQEGSQPEERRYCDTYEEAIDELWRLIKLPPSRIVVDIEAKNLNPWKADSKVLSIGFSDRPGYASVICLYHRDTPFTGNQIGTMVKFLRFLFQNTLHEFIEQYGKFDTKYLLISLGIVTINFKWDPMLMHYIGVTEESGTHGLKDFAWQYTNKGGYDNELDDFKKTLPEKDRYNYDLIPWNILKPYNGMDCDVTYRVFDQLLPVIEDGDEDIRWLYHNIMIPGSMALQTIEINGMYVDTKWLDFLNEKYPEEIERISDKLHQFPEVLSVEREYDSKWEERCNIGLIKKAVRTEEQQDKFEKYKRYDPSKRGNKFKFSSTQQLQELLYVRLGLRGEMLTEKGEDFRKENGISMKRLKELPYTCFSTSDDALKGLAKQHPMPEILQEFRKANHLMNNFVRGMYENLTPDGLVHPTMNIHGTATGRTSSNDPNAQQFPRKVSSPLLFQYHHEIKRLFVSRFGEDGVIIQLDYSQVEVRILAVLADDDVLKNLFKSGIDIHIDNASDAFGIPASEVTKDQRTASKKVTFGIIYQESPQGLSDDLKMEGIIMSKAECADFIAKWFKKFVKSDKWIKNTKRMVRIEKQVKNALGRIRHLPTIDSTEDSIRGEAERQACNSPIQSTSADITLMALIQINKWLKDTNKRSVIFVTVHDSIGLDCPKDEVLEVSSHVKYIMENISEYNEKYKFLGDMPLVVDLEIGYDYGTLYECKGYNLEEIGVDNFIQSQQAKKAAKEQEAYSKAEASGTIIPKFAYSYWNKVSS